MSVKLRVMIMLTSEMDAGIRSALRADESETFQQFVRGAIAAELRMREGSVRSLVAQTSPRIPGRVWEGTDDAPLATAVTEPTVGEGTTLPRRSARVHSENPMDGVPGFLKNK